MGIIKPLPSYSNKIHQTFREWSAVKKLVFSGVLAAFAAILQAAGGLIPGIGLLISPFSTLPLLLATLISLQYGCFTYILTIFLLLIMEASELFIFPFTTGLLGLGMGLGLYKFNKPTKIIMVNGLLLFLGICLPLYGLKFPVLGPGIQPVLKVEILGGIFIFTSLYSWLWLKFSLSFLKRMDKFLSLDK